MEMRITYLAYKERRDCFSLSVCALPAVTDTALSHGSNLIYGVLRYRISVTVVTPILIMQYGEISLRAQYKRKNVCVA